MARRFRNIRDVMKLLPIDGCARDAIRRFNLAPNVDGKARSVRELAEDIGFEVDQISGLGKKTGRLVTDAFAKNGYRIEVNKNHSVQARRWAVLHEIGHYFLHVDWDDPLADDMAFDASGETFYIDTEEEAEANSFAEVILFGDGALMAADRLHGGNINRIARHFGVSEKVVQIALERYR